MRTAHAIHTVHYLHSTLLCTCTDVFTRDVPWALGKKLLALYTGIISTVVNF